MTFQTFKCCFHAVSTQFPVPWLQFRIQRSLQRFNDFSYAPGLGGIRLAGLAGLADPEVPSGRGPAALVAGYEGSHLGSDGTEK
jgi:hypothetical protein